MQHLFIHTLVVHASTEVGREDGTPILEEATSASFPCYKDDPYEGVEKAKVATKVKQVPVILCGGEVPVTRDDHVSVTDELGTQRYAVDKIITATAPMSSGGLHHLELECTRVVNP